MHNPFAAHLRQVFWPAATQLDATESSPPVWAAVFAGAGLGLAWGIAARIWMRLISTQPEFSIPGTAAILLIATIFGACVGFAYVARRRGWRQWGHYIPRGLAVAFFVPFGIAGGTPLMIAVLLATLAVTHTAAIGLWVLALLVLLALVATDISLPAGAALIVPAVAVAVTAWKLIILRWGDGSRLRRIDTWVERAGRAILLLLAAFAFGVVARQIMADKPDLLALLYIVLYIVLLYPLFLALRIGLAPRIAATPRPRSTGS